MKKVVLLSLVVAGMLSVPTAYAKSAQTKAYLQGTVVGVDRHHRAERVPGENPSDAPLADPEVFSYDISVNVSCGTYVGRFRSWYDYLPSVFKVDQKIQLRLTRNLMYVAVPNEKDIELSIVGKRMEKGPCGEREVASR